MNKYLPNFYIYKRVTGSIQLLQRGIQSSMWKRFFIFILFHFFFCSMEESWKSSEARVDLTQWLKTFGFCWDSADLARTHGIRLQGLITSIIICSNLLRGLKDVLGLVQQLLIVTFIIIVENVWSFWRI